MVAVVVGRAGRAESRSFELPIVAAAVALALVSGCSCASEPGPGDAGRDGGARPDAPAIDALAPRDSGADAAPLDAPPATPDAPDAFVPPDAPMDDAPDAPRPPRMVTCADPAPPGADVAALPRPYTGGTCPLLVPGINTITSGGRTRQFILVVPAGLDPSERLPVLFLWHWLGGEADDFLTRGEVQAGADEARFIAVIPESRGDLRLQWPYSLIDSAARMEEEATFFDDMLSCVSEAFPTNNDCVSSVGVSAGALWTSQLAQLRAEHLSSIIVLSGGVGTSGDLLNPIHPWRGAAHAMPAIVLWGGPTDWCGVNFNVLSANLEGSLETDGHFFVECIHDCSHAEPPLDPPPGLSKYAGLWRFALDHPFWLDDGESPYQATGLPAGMPTWCGIGAGSATIRSGMCEGGVLGSCL